jgi:hypothetical protein
LNAPPIPKNVKEAIQGRHSKYFLQAMLNEIESIRNRDSYDVVVPPTGRRVIRSRWVYDYKVDPYGFIKRFKARLVADGRSQIKSQDYDDTHSPVVKIKAVRLMIAMSVLLGLKIELCDINTAYLYAPLTHTNYMTMPQGFHEYAPDGTPYVCKLKQSLYGLHQSGREWHTRLKNVFLKHGYTRLKSEPCAFMKIDTETGKFILALVYVDDIIIASTDQAVIARVKKMLKSEFSIKDIGNADWILKIQIKDVTGGKWIGQITYITKILQKYDQWDIPENKWKDTPMSVSWKHDPLSPELKSKVASDYVSLVASLMYLAQQTQPDILFAVNTLAQFQRGPPRECHYHASIRILRYLQKTLDLGLYYRKSDDGTIFMFESDAVDATDPPKLALPLPEGALPEGWADASFGREYDSKSRSAYVFMVFGCLVSWFSKKQPTTALSSTEAELIALVESIKEAMWLRTFLTEVGVSFKEPTIVHQDNQSAIAIALNPIHHGRVKHVDVKTNYIRENIDNSTVKLVYCPTEMMIADILTKPLPAPQHRRIISLMGMKSYDEVGSRHSNKSQAISVVYHH